jgi:23S rRNA (cytosine1962-C5)-methyltransferase
LKDIPTLILKKGREKPILRRHPWIFSGSIKDVIGKPASGQTVRVLDAEGQFLAWGSFSPHSQIRTRILSWTEAEPIGPSLFKKRLEQSLQDRSRVDIDSDAMRLVHAESDGLPGLIVDQYRDILVVQILSAGIEKWRDHLIQLLVELTGARTIYERSDAEVRVLEGLNKRTGLLYGEEPPALVEIKEKDLTFQVDVRQGHKTGFYLDQRANRALVGSLAEGKEILDCFSYTGGFALHALRGRASSVSLIESSPEMMAMAQTHFQLNGFPLDKSEFVVGDVFEELRTYRDKARSFDGVILDPPKFAPTASHAAQAARGYKDINLWAFKLVRSGGFLCTFSCSGGVDRDFFQKIVADAALDAGVRAKIITQLWQDADHPVGLNFPEGSYLKGFIIWVER